MEKSAPQIIADYNAAGQDSVFKFYDSLPKNEQKALIEQASLIDLAEIQHLNDTLVQAKGHEDLDLDGIEPAPFTALPRNGGDAAKWDEAIAAGEAALRAGRVAAFTVAGGQGTRLGYDGPKGTYPVTPVNQNTLFQVFAEKIIAASRRYEKVIPWFIMTSNINHEATVSFFEKNQFFGLEEGQVEFFRQGLMPAVSTEGKIMLQDKSTIAQNPDGHGGSLRALVRSGAIAKMEAAGADIISYFQVDNPLVKAIDPAFIGFHLLAKSEMSSKMLPKAYPDEKLGHFCMQNGNCVVIEYSDMPSALTEQRNENGKLRFIAGSIAIHIMDRDFVKRLGGEDATVALPFHRADKKIKTIDADGKPVAPESPNGIKFEMFVFDALPFAKNPIVIETAREDDFSPVKNAEGVDSPQQSKEDQLREFARWTKAAGIAIETDETGLPSITFEISPLFADSETNFVAKWNRLAEKPEITEGTVLK